ncbi:MAG: ABC transporter substrate-binding protein [Deltaproteobacteria bacterium]|nr:ABC transporter substrate-binding protein [Deltaproteobacteria bacterium]
MRRRWRKFGVLLFALMTVSASAMAGEALRAIEAHVNRVLEVVDNPALKDKAVKEEKVQSIVDEIFNYAELSKRALAIHWQSFSPEQQKEFTHLFGKLLRQVYMDRILAHTNEKVVFGKETRLSENRIEVESEILMPTKSIPVRYRMILQKGQWKIYDVVVEGVSLVQNYRSQFRGILSKETPEGLLRILRQKVA